MLFDGDLLLDMEMTIYEDLMVKCGGFSVTLSGSHFHFRTPFTSVWDTACEKKKTRLGTLGTLGTTHCPTFFLFSTQKIKIKYKNTDCLFVILIQHSTNIQPLNRFNNTKPLED